MSEEEESWEQQKIPVVVVESHQHVCEHIHHVLRRNKKLWTKEWFIVHYDAHPDLACPSSIVPAVACFRPRQPATTNAATNNGKNLYELLDSTTSGIAEWILPLVLAANLRRVYWIHPPTTPTAHQTVEQQLPDGEHRYRVGAWLPPVKRSQSSVSSFLDLSPEAVVKVDWDCSYYRDDDAVVPSNELLLPQPLHLTVCEQQDDFLQDQESTTQQPHVLDICLDYFDCRNPFVTDLEELDSNVTSALLCVVFQSTLYHKDSCASRSREQVQCFQRRLLQLFSPVNGLHNNDDDTSSSSVKFFSNHYYHDPTHGEHLVENLLVSIRQSTADPARLRLLVEEALPNLTMPVRCHQTLPDNDDIIFLGQKSPPMLISIARSANDGFTPADRVDELQNAVLQRLHDECCACGSRHRHTPHTNSSACQLHIVFDYGAWEGSTL